MGSDFFFKNELPEAGVDDGSQMENFRFGNPSLVRQSSIYSLTLDELQTGLGKDFGSMNMDEFLKNVWFAEETQGSGASMAVAPEVNSGNLDRQFSLPRQGSLNLPRMLSLKTVDEVFRDMIKETVGQRTNEPTPFLQRQPTLGEMTLEEFLVRAGVVREDTQVASMSNNGVFASNFCHNMVDNANSRSGPDFGLALSFGQPECSSGNLSKVVVDQYAKNTGNQEATRFNQPLGQQQQLSWPSDLYNQSRTVQKTPLQQQQLFQRPPAMSLATQVQLPTDSELNSTGIGNGLPLSNAGDAGRNCSQVGHDKFVVIEDSKTSIRALSPVNNSFARRDVGAGGGTNSNILGAADIKTTTASHANEITYNGLRKKDVDDFSLSPVPYALHGGLRGRRGGGVVEKVIERRQKRMIKNRESAARSRARKQAYTMELEAEIAKLKDANMKLQKKQEKIIEMQKAQENKNLNQENVHKKKCLRRTWTGPW